VAERDDQDDEGNLGPEGSAEPAGRFFRQVDVRRRRRRRQRSPTAQNQRQRTPDQEDNDHHGGDLHDAQSLGARFGDALDVRPPEVNRHRDAEEYGEGIWVRAPGLMESFADLVKQPPQILAGADDADRAGEDVIHDQRGYGQLGDGRSHAVAHNHVYAAAHEHAGAFQVHRADSVAEQHHGQYHPGRGLADGLLGDASDVVHRGGHVVEHDGGRLPDRDERERYRGSDDDFGGGGRLCGGKPGRRRRPGIHAFTIRTFRPSRRRSRVSWVSQEGHQRLFGAPTITTASCGSARRRASQRSRQRKTWMAMFSGTMDLSWRSVNATGTSGAVSGNG